MSMKETMTKNEKKKLLIDEFADTDNLNDSDNYSNYQNDYNNYQNDYMKKMPALHCEERVFLCCFFVIFQYEIGVIDHGIIHRFAFRLDFTG